MGIMAAKMGAMKKKKRNNVELFANFTTHTFTTAGKNGRHGPTLAEMRAAYPVASWATNNTFFHLGRAQGYQVFQVPTDGIYEIEIAGARGQTATNYSTNVPGYGAIIKARVQLTTATKLEMVVGQLPETGNVVSASSCSGGGGGSFVGIFGSNTPLVVAGGGGGYYGTAPSQAVMNGQTRIQPQYAGYSYSPAASGVNPSPGYGGCGYHGGGGGGWNGSGDIYPNQAIASAAVTNSDTLAQMSTHGASFIGGSVTSTTGTFYATGGNSNLVAPNCQGGFGGGGGGHSGNNSGGGGGGYSGGLGGQTSVGGTYLSATGGGSFIISNATNIATSDGNFDGVSTFNGGAITNLGTFNAGAGYIKITLISSTGGTGTSFLPGSSMINVATGFSSWSDKVLVTSNNIGLSTTVSNDADGYYTTDSFGAKWYIAANFGHGVSAPTRWNGHMWKKLGTNVTSIVGQQNVSKSVSIAAGGFLCDAVSFTNTSGDGFSNWYSDSKTNQAYPNINDAIVSTITSSKYNANFDAAGATADANGGAVYWTPPTGAKEVMIDFGNSHSNSICSLVVWDNVSQTVVYTVIYGKLGTVNVASDAINDANTRTFICRHNSNYVYIMSDHAGTIAGSHYYLYR